MTVISEQANLANKPQGKRIILIMVTIPIVIILISTLLYYMAEHKVINLGTVNYGELISPPLKLTDLELKTLDQQAFDYLQAEPKWSFVVIGGKDCDSLCEKMLYLSRQTNTALGKKMNQVRRYYLSAEDGVSSTFKQRLLADYPQLTVANVNNKALHVLFKHSGIEPLASKQFFVVDPHGWIMMRYRVANVDSDSLNVMGKKIIKDMKRLLK